MESRSDYYRGISRGNKRHFYCFDCSRHYSRRLVDILEQQRAGDNCKFCDSDFIEKVDDPITHRPPVVATYSMPDTPAHTTHIQDEPETTTFRTVRRTLRLPNSSPFVRDVLMQLFPQVFRRASLDRIETIRHILNTLNLFEAGGESGSGPTDREFVDKLEKRPYHTVEDKDMLGGCAICTDGFTDDDLLISLECKHAFHEHCLLPWLELNNSCPNCRMGLPRQGG